MVFADDGEVVLVNAAWTGISGYRRRRAAHACRPGRGSAYGERAEAMNAVIASAVRPRARASTTASARSRRRAARSGSGTSSPRRSAATRSGRRMLVTNAIDVTERRRLEQVLAEKEARMRLAMEAANYGGWEWDRGRRRDGLDRQDARAARRRRRRADQLRACSSSASIPTTGRCASGRSPRPG